MLSVIPRTTMHIATKTESLINRIFIPDATIRLQDLENAKISEILKGLKEAGVKVVRKYMPTTDNFVREEAQVIETPKGSTIVHLPTINRSYIGEATPNNITIKFDRNGNPLQLVNIVKDEDFADVAILRTQKGVKALQNKSNDVTPYQLSYIDKSFNQRTRTVSEIGESKEQIAKMDYEDFTPIEIPAGYPRMTTSRLDTQKEVHSLSNDYYSYDTKQNHSGYTPCEDIKFCGYDRDNGLDPFGSVWQGII